MTTVATHARKIGDLEGFDIIINDLSGDAVDRKLNGALASSDYEKMLKHTATVADWKRLRFHARNAGYTCDVLMGGWPSGEGQHVASYGSRILRG